MNGIRFTATSAALMATLALAWPAHAASVTALPSGTAITVPHQVNSYNSGPLTLSDGTIASRTGGNTYMGYNGYQLFGTNGTWNYPPIQGPTMPDYINALNVGGSVKFTFANAVAGFGGFFNYNPAAAGPSVIAVYDVNNKLIESQTLTFNFNRPQDDTTAAGSGLGQFMGFLESTPSIKYFTMTNGNIAGTHFVVQATAVPEPSEAALMFAGLACLGALAGRRLKRRA